MKKILLGFLLIFSISISSSAQYNQLIDENKEWVISSVNWITSQTNPFPTVETSYYFTYFDGDSIVGGVTYKKLFTQTFHKTIEEPPGDTISVNNVIQAPYFWALLREDTLVKQVFIVQQGTSLEKLLFDFSLNLGDTLETDLITMFGVSGEIDSVESILIGNSVRSVHYFDGSSGIDINNLRANYMIEGMGGPGGVINPFYLVGLGFTLSDYIVCYRESGDSLFGGCDYPDFVTSLNDLDRFEIDFKMYPNPGNSQLIITHDLSNKQRLSLEIIDLQGKKQLVKVVSVNEVKLDVSDLPQGIYFVQLKSEEGLIATQKWVKLTD